MSRALAILLLAACGGSLPSQQQIVETPAATTRSPTQQSNIEAPPASVSDEERYHVVQQFEDMDVTQRAYQEAEQDRPAPAAPLQGQPPPPNARRKGVAEQAPPPPTKKGPAEQATLPPPPPEPRSGAAAPPPSATP